MRVKCKALLPNDDQAKSLGIGKYYFPGQMEFRLKMNQEYVVFGITFMGGVPWVEILDESETYSYSVPLFLFDIVDGLVSRYWVARVLGEDLTLWPPSFYRPYYHDDLTEGVPEVVEDFNRVKQLILDEDALHGTNQSRTATNKPQ